MSFFFNLNSESTLDIQDYKWRNAWIIKVFYGNKDFIQGAWSWVQVALCMFITVFTLKTVYNLKTHARMVYKKYVKHDYEWLKSRTIHVKGMLKNDVTGALLENMLNEHLQDTESKILTIWVVPDYRKLTELEEKRKDLEDLSHLLGIKEPTVMRIWVKKKHRTEKYYKQKLEEIEDKIREELTKPIKSSGHAYVVFDSYYSMSRCLQKYRETPCQTWKIICSSFLNIITMKNKNGDDPRETFTRYHDHDDFPKSEYKK